jgi:DNA-binding XRE family transcriptional regulator
MRAESIAPGVWYMSGRRSDYCMEKEDIGMKDDREAKLIRKQRKTLGMTQTQVAAEIGIELSQYQKYEYGVAKLSNARMKLGLRICAALELNPFDAVFESGEDLAGVDKGKRSQNHSP